MHRRLFMTLLSVHALLSITAGCEEGDAGRSALMLEDSVGVRVFRVPSGAEVVEWRVSDAPELLIGPDDGADSGSLFQIRAAHRFQDGSIVVANGGSYELRFYSKDGALQRTVGREGGGPGEFGGMSWLKVAADSLWVNDRRYDRVSVFDGQGRLARTISLRSEMTEAWATAEGVFEDGALLVSQNDPSWSPSPGLGEVHDFLHVRRPDGSTTGLGRYFRAETFWQELEPGHMADGGRPFGRIASLATYGGAWYYTAGDEYQVEQYDQEGTLRAIYALSREPPAVGPQDLDTYLARMRGDRAEPSLRERIMRNAPLPERMPAYEDLAIDRNGDVWARAHAGAEVRNCWDVFQRTPPTFGSICLPERFQVLDIGDEWLLGVLRDELDVERVALFALMK